MNKLLATATLTCGLLVARPAIGDDDDGDRRAPSASIGARLGVIAPQPFNELGSFPLAGLEAGYLAPVMGRRLQIGAAISYSRPPASGGGMDSRLSGGEYAWELQQELLVLELAGTYRLRPPDSGVVPYGRLGARLYFLDTRLDGMSGSDAAFGEHQEGSSEPGIVVGGGVEASVGPGTILGQLDVGFSDLNEQLTGNSNTGALEVTAGYRVFF